MGLFGYGPVWAKVGPATVPSSAAPTEPSAVRRVIELRFISCLLRCNWKGLNGRQAVKRPFGSGSRSSESVRLISKMCASQMRSIAFITFSADIRKILAHIGVDSQAPRITPARGPPLWEGEGAQETGESVEALPDWDMATQAPPDYPEDQRINW